MKVVIIEDEIPAAEKLRQYLLRNDPSVEVLAVLASVKAAVGWLEKNQDKSDLIFMDIQLSDGLCFEIFDRVKLNKPVIFVTAFDEYAVEAFKVNSIDYILKPVTFTELERALKKVETLRSQLVKPVDFTQIVKDLSRRKFRERFIIKTGTHLHSIKSKEIGVLYAEGRTLYLVSFENRKAIIDFNLQDLEELLDPEVFFRVNRSYIVNINAIDEVVLYSNSRLKIKLKLDLKEEIIVSREKVAAFKDWFGGG